MMEVLRTWLFGLTAVSLLLALAEALVSQEGIRRVLRLAGGVLMIVVLLQPVVQIDLEDLSLSLEAYQQEVETLTEEYAQQQDLAQYCTTAEQLTLQLQQLKETQQLSIKNIF